MPSPEKFRETLDDFKVSQDVIDEMYQNFGKLESKTNKKTSPRSSSRRWM